MFKTISCDATAEIVEKKSRFIANIFYVETVDKAEEKIKEIKKKYYDARHNCFAYSIFSKDGLINRFSDDGEPSGTAGLPMLNILTGKQITNCAVIVTRYFGGILLGTGGLVRAYTNSAIEALNKIEIVEKDLGLEVEIKVSYSDFEKLKYYLKQNDVNIIDSNFSSEVISIIEIAEDKLNNMLEKRNELTFNIIDYNILKEKYIS